MNLRPFLFLIPWLFIPSVQADSPKMSLSDCFQAALKRSETVAISDQEISAARGRYSQALGTLLPSFSVNASELLQASSPSVMDLSRLTLDTQTASTYRARMSK